MRKIQRGNIITCENTIIFCQKLLNIINQIYSYINLEPFTYDVYKKCSSYNVCLHANCWNMAITVCEFMPIYQRTLNMGVIQ